MKKTILSVLVCISLCGCKLIRLANQEQVHIIERSYKTSGPMAMVSIDIDSVKNVPFLFDTGATRTFVSNPDLVPYSANRTYVKFGKTLTADGKKTPTAYTAVQIKTPWFESDNKIIGLFPSPKGPCDQQAALNGILGLDAFLDSEVVLEIFYGDSLINSHLRGKYAVALDQGFRNVNAVFDNHGIYIPIEIDGKSQLYMFDSGNNAGIITVYDESLDARTSEKTIIEGRPFKSFADGFGQQTIIFEGTAKIGGISFNSSLLMQKTGYQFNNIGVSALRLFDWIIDFRDKQVFARRNKLESAITEIKKQYYTSIVDGKLEIISKLKNAGDYRLGDKIESVNGEKVNAQNICRIQNLLATTDWKTLEIIVSK